MVNKRLVFLAFFLFGDFLQIVPCGKSPSNPTIWGEEFLELIFQESNKQI